MPLRAYVDGQEVIAPLVSESGWDALRGNQIAGESRIVLPCCGAEGFMRRSPLGTQHFAHKRAAPDCDLGGETFEHLKAKTEIVNAARLAGCDASTEVAGADWRADVLVARGSVRIAFEVQWSRLSLQDCLARQARYERDGVRGCWFFRRPPQQLASASAGQRRPSAARELPLFHLVASAAADFSVRLNGRSHPLQEFVIKLLSGGVAAAGAACRPVRACVCALRLAQPGLRARRAAYCRLRTAFS